MSEAYGAFALAYDEALGQRFFEAVRPLLEDALERHPAMKRTHLDLACGTGKALDLFRALGWRSTGLDASIPMLDQAAGRRVAGDLRALPFRSKFSRVTCLYDSINHLLELDDLKTAFREVRGVMDVDSLFLFDINHPDIYPEIWGDSEPYVASGADFHLEIATSYRRRDRLALAHVTGWARIGGRRIEIDERYRQRSWTEKQIEMAMSDAGLAAVEIADFDPYEEGAPTEAPSVKIFYVAGVRP